MEENKTSPHEIIVTILLAIFMVYIFLKVLFF
jgi:regulatory protein YycI of two-component signal transduction system YycFG